MQLMGVQEFTKALKRLSGFRRLAVLVNSRTLIVCSHATHVSIRQLDLAPAIALLQERCKKHAQLWESDQEQQLAELCGRNALCLTIVASFINAGRCTIQVRFQPRNWLQSGK